jgi:hypothetical protein
MLVILASVVILVSESRGIHSHILLSQIRDYPNLESHVSVFISPRNKEPQLYTQTLGSIFSPPTTRRTTVEAFEIASAWVAVFCNTTLANTEFPVNNIKIQLTPHRKHITVPLYNPTCYFCLRKQSLFIVTDTKHTNILCI